MNIKSHLKIERIKSYRFTGIKPANLRSVRISIGDNHQMSRIITENQILRLAKNPAVFAQCQGYRLEGIGIFKCGKWQLYADNREGSWYDKSELPVVLKAFPKVKDLDVRISHSLCPDCSRVMHNEIDELK